MLMTTLFIVFFLLTSFNILVITEQDCVCGEPSCDTKKHILISR